MLPSISVYLDFCFQSIGESQKAKIQSSFDQNWIQKEFKLTQFVSQEIATFIETLCIEPEFQCFLVAVVSEHYTSSSQRGGQVLPAVVSIIASIFNIKSILTTSNQVDCLKFRASIMNLHHDDFSSSHFKALSARITATPPSPRDVVLTLSSLIVATASKNSLLCSFLKAELFQQMFLFDDCIQMLLRVCSFSILAFKEAVLDSEALRNLTLEEIVSALFSIKSSLAQFHSATPFGFQLPSGWSSVKSNITRRTYYFNTKSKALLMQRPRPSLSSLESCISSMTAFLLISLFENPASKCSTTSTVASVAHCFASNQAFASSLADVFSRIQAFHYLHVLSTTTQHPLRTETQLFLVDQQNSSDVTQGLDVKFDFSHNVGRKICSNCLMFCSSLFYQSKPEEENSPAPAVAPSDADFSFMDEIFDLAHTTTFHSAADALQNGHNVFVFSNKDRYSGNFQATKMHGDGILLFSDGSCYRGQFKEGEMHGQGVLIQSDVTKYEGSFSKNKRDGKGKIVFGKSGSFYIGDWKQNRRHGEGQFESFCNSRVLSSVVVAGEKFKGLYSNDCRNGVGTSTHFNGETLTCSWIDGSSIEHDTFQRKFISKNGDTVCLSCVLKDRPSFQSLGDIGSTTAAVFTHERPLFQHCIKEALTRNFLCDRFSDNLGSPCHFSFSGSGCALSLLCFFSFCDHITDHVFIHCASIFSLAGAG
jgi:hypothetical protein